MPQEKREHGKSEEEPEVEPPTGDGDTYNTSKRAKTGVGHEPPPVDLREKGESEES